MKSAHEKEKEAYLRYDRLVVEGQAYVFDNERGRPVQVDLKPRIASHKPRILIYYPRFEV